MEGLYKIVRRYPFISIARNLGVAVLSLVAVQGQTSSAQTPPVINCLGRPVTSLDFSAPVLETGTALQTNAIYRYTDVAPGVDARVQILGFDGGGSLNVFDNNTGLSTYMQPEINSTGNSAVDFSISFITSANQPVQLDIAASAIDVDGDSSSLREYAEFDAVLLGYALNSTTELDVDASGPSSPTRRRFESRTFLTAPGIDPTAEDNIVTTFYTDVSSFEYRIGTLGTGNSTRLTSLGFDCPNLTTPAYSSETPEDFGDAPVNNYGNPIHTLVNGVRLGAANDADAGSYNSPTASGDNGDDGLAVPDFLVGEVKTLTANVVGANGKLQAWFDWNQDGDFLDAGEQVVTNLTDGNSDGQISFNVSAPITALIGNTFARFRWSTASDVEPGEAAGDGEVEDYQLAIIDNPASLSVVKSVQVFDPDSDGLYALPGNVMVYTISIENQGGGPVDDGAIKLVDNLPENVEFYFDDYDPALPGTAPAVLVEGSIPSSVVCCESGELTYSDDARGTASPIFDYAPMTGYDDKVTFLKFVPAGSMAAAQGTDSSSFELKFKVRIK